jgi:hypothetical protein
MNSATSGVASPSVAAPSKPTEEVIVMKCDRSISLLLAGEENYLIETHNHTD